MSINKGFFVVVAMALGLAVGAVGCEREKGPMEKAGEKIDEVIDDIAHPNEGPLEEAGRKVDEKVEDAKEKLED